MDEFLTTRLSDLVTTPSRDADKHRVYPASGGAAGVTAALAAWVAAAAADRSREHWDEAGGARAQAQALATRALELAEGVRAEYATARKALDEPDPGLGLAVRRAAEPALALVATAADIAALAEQIADRGDGDIQADAGAAAILAAAAAQTSAILVRVNLVVGPDQEPATRAAEHAQAASLAAARAAKDLG